MALMTIAQRLASEGRREGLEQGLEQGLERGRAEGQATLILMLLEQRFGPIPADVVDRVRSADTAELTVWSKSLLCARDLEGVFGSSAAR